MLWFNSINDGFRRVGLAVALGASAAAQTPDPGARASEKPKESAAATAASASQPVEVASSDMSSLNRLLPVGKSARKVTIPTVDEDGRLESVVTMGKITRVDEENFDLEKVVLTSFDKPDPAAPDATPSATVINLQTARYHAPTRVLVSDTRVTIRKPTLFLSGDSLRYDSASGKARIIGKSYTLITETPREETDVPPEEPEDDTDDLEDTEESESPASPGPKPPPTRQ